MTPTVVNLDEGGLGHSSAKRPGRPVAHRRPAGLTDADVQALGKLSEALEVVEHARGLLYGFHRLSGTADLTLQDAVRMFRDAGHQELADKLEQILVGRDVIAGRWSFQLVEAYDDGYWSVFRDLEAQARQVLGGAEPHLYEAELQHREQAVTDPPGSTTDSS
jgi:hypothetical protein